MFGSPSVQEEDFDVLGMFQMTWKQRIYGFGICYILGLVIEFLSLLSFRNKTKFSLLYSIGNLLSLFSTSFISGPKNQIKSMFHKSRLIATLIYIISLVLTIILAILKLKGPCLLMMVVQTLALSWYSLSYIPYARSLVRNMAKNIVDS